MKPFGTIPIEISFTGFVLGSTWLIGQAIDVPVNLPSGERAPFIDLHYMYPLLGVAIWGLFVLVGQRNRLAWTYLIALPCYAIVLVCHFNLQLWWPLINPIPWDPEFWQIDQLFRPVIYGSFKVREAMVPIFGLGQNAYMITYIMMFYTSFSVHALQGPSQFRRLFLSALFFQGIGGFCYLVMPALGPFIYEPGLIMLHSDAQRGMVDTYHQIAAGGPTWIRANGSANLTAGLGAMPSLHVGGAFLFLYFAWRHAKILVPVYSIFFTFILVSAVATRWHYLIDLPFGLMLAVVSIRFAEQVEQGIDEPISPADFGQNTWRQLLANAGRVRAQVPNVVRTAKLKP